MDKQSILRQIPRVDDLVGYVKKTNAAQSLPQYVILQACREVLESLRCAALAGDFVKIPEINDIVKQAIEKAIFSDSYSLRPVINATGVVLHTNLGRAILSEKAAENVKKIATSYSTLEYDVKSGERGSRQTHIESLICSITGAEAAFAVNNNAAAVMLTLAAMCKNKEVVVSRGELVEIGGSFRVPDIMELSGATLKEVGTTNKTKLSDYQKAINENTAALLKVHTSNFKIVGFCEDVKIDALAALGKDRNIPVIYDLGSGLMTDNLICDELTVKQSLVGGADVVCFSADKLFGGPQAGIIAGKKEYIDVLKAHQLARAFRIDKLCLAALEVTLKMYLNPDENNQIPTVAFLTETQERLKTKAKTLCKMLSRDKNAFKSAVKQSEGQVGGGCAPGEGLPSFVVEITADSKSAEAIEKELRLFEIPIITRINKGSVLIDVRTVRKGEFVTIVQAFKKIFSNKNEGQCAVAADD